MLSKEYSYLEHLNEETLFREYKVASMNHLGMGLSEDSAEYYLRTEKWVFDKKMKDNIYFIIKQYFKKYICSFLNPVENRYKEFNKAVLYYGVSDNGIIEGIPFKKPLNIHRLKDYLKSILFSYQIKSNIDKNILWEAFDIKLIKLNINHKIKSKIDYYKRFKVEEEKAKKIMSDYYLRLNIFYKTLKLYSNKLINIIENPITQKQLLEYVYYKTENKNINIYQIIRRKIKHKLYCKNIDHFEIQKSKEDIYNVYYWVTKYKDDMIDFIRSNRPKKPYKLIPRKYYPINVLNQMDKMIPIWLNSNNINLYIIKMTFNKKLVIEHYPHLSYYNDDIKKYIYCYRSLDNLGMPCCVPF
jgi:hypothetical protein